MKRRKRKNKLLKLLLFILINILLILIMLTMYVKETFYDVSFDQIIYSLKTASGTSQDVIIGGAKYIIPKVLVIDLLLVLCFILFKVVNKNITNNLILNIYFKDKLFSFSIIPISKIIKIIGLLLFTCISLFYVGNGIGLFTYLFSNADSNLFDKYYVDPYETKITSSDEKQNLIFIYVESLETSLFSNQNGGDFNESIIPNLENIAKDNINISATNTLGGAYMYRGSEWTIAGIVSQSAGIPLKISNTDGEIFNNYNGAYLPGAYALGEVLEDNGYKNYFMLGSDATFGGRKLYFKQHGNYQIYDYNYAIKHKWIDKDYYIWWGFEDSKLYEFAKKQLKEISSKGEPFNFTMLTADTHFPDGYVDESCDNTYSQRYLNSYHCTDKMLGEFINWIQKQDFYEDTTIVIVGDHLSMQANLSDMFETGDIRYIYNAIINPKSDVTSLNNRNFSSMDMYPTILYSLGFEIEGNRLGLGTNLFSDKKTLSEKLGIEKYNEELAHNSSYYNKNIIASTRK